jgi:hypothetical protein
MLERRPKTYTPDGLFEKFNEYFKYMETQVWFKTDAIKSGERAGEIINIPVKTPLSRKGFCVYAKMNEQTLRNYASGRAPYEDYFDLCACALDKIDNNQIEGALVGVYNHHIVARLNGLADHQDIVSNGEKLNQQIIVQTIPTHPLSTDDTSAD